MATINSLPPEVLNAVFRFHVSYPLNPPARIEEMLVHHPFRITHVCSWWRKFASADPFMWRTVLMHTQGKHRSSNLFVLNEWLQRSGALKLDIIIYDARPEPFLREVMGAFESCLEKWASVYLEVHPASLSQFGFATNYWELACHLERLHVLTLDSAELGPVLRIQSTVLRDLEIDQNNLDLLISPNIKHNPNLLRLKIGPGATLTDPENILKWISHFPNLRTLELTFLWREWNTYWNWEYADTFSPVQITLPDLWLLSVDEWDSAFTQPFINNLRLPSLSNLELSSKPQFDLGRHPATSLIQRSQCQLTHLSLRQTTVDDFSSCIQLCPMLESLEGDLSLWKLIEQGLLVLRGDNKDVSPHLQHIGIATRVSDPYPNVPESIEPLVNVVASRFEYEGEESSWPKNLCSVRFSLKHHRAPVFDLPNHPLFEPFIAEGLEIYDT